jgi:tetratricopeptide (TPR) repeat protein
VILVPAVLFGALEAVLRVAGYGYPTDFFVSEDGGRTWTGNVRFAWRFSPPGTASSPDLFVMAGEKPAGTVRIFVLGESAAMGTPDPSFSFGRILEVMLRQRHPAVRFEVINAAMMGIDSYAVLDIARDAARHQPDIFVVYMGNNEAVGPWSPLVVPAGLGSSRAVARAALAVKRTKVGQWVESAIRRARGEHGPAESQSLETFLDCAVAPGDPRLSAVYDHLGANLRGVCRAARAAGAKAVVSTVAVNLKDCAPLASRHRADMTEAERVAWEQRVLAAEGDEAAGCIRQAAQGYEDALKIDDRYADVHFRLGRCLLGLGRREEALGHYVLACDLDALPFRADSAVNVAIRSAASGREAEGIFFVDGAGALASAAATPGLPGDDLFYEHVHMTFEGNYRLAAALLPAVEAALPASAAGPASGPVPAADRCAEALAFTDWDRLRLAGAMVRLMSRPPLTNQSDHAVREQRAVKVMADLGRAGTPPGRDEATRRYEEALEKNPDDWRLHDNLAALRLECGDYAGAIDHWRAVRLTFPRLPVLLIRISEARARQGKMDEAEACLREALDLAPDGAEVHRAMSQILRAKGDLDGAARHAARALQLRPDAAGHCYLGDMLAEAGRTAEAVACYQQGLGLKPDDPQLNAACATVILDLGRSAEAQKHFRAALQADPHHVPARCGLARALARQGKTREAEAQYRLVLALNGRIPKALAGLAWLLATDRDPRRRSAAEALRLAQEACYDTRRQAPEPLESLAAAYGELGKFEDAVQAADAALQLAVASGNRALADEIRRHLELYRAGKPCREP